jgi:hypothetical protein
MRKQISVVWPVGLWYFIMAVGKDKIHVYQKSVNVILYEKSHEKHD